MIKLYIILILFYLIVVGYCSTYLDGVEYIKANALKGWVIDSNDNLIPEDTDQTIGDSSNPISDFISEDVNGTPVTFQNLADGQRALREGTSILPFSGADSVADSVWTYTITDDSGGGIFYFVINNKALIYAGSTMSVNITSYAGTDANPKMIYVYVQNNGSDVPELVASNTDPDGSPGVDHVHVASILAGTVGVSSATNYGCASEAMTGTGMIDNIFHEAFYRGIQYISGFAPTVTSSDVTFGSGITRLIFRNYNIDSLSVNSDYQYYRNNDGSYASDSTFTYGDKYSDGVAISDNRYFNVVIGILNCNGDTKIFSIPQTSVYGEYTVIANALSDTRNAARYYPINFFQRKLFIPLIRIVVQNTGTGVLQQFSSGAYFEDLRLRIHQ